MNTHYTAYKLWDRKSRRHDWQLVVEQDHPITDDQIDRYIMAQMVYPDHLGMSQETEPIAHIMEHNDFARPSNDPRIVSYDPDGFCGDA